MAERDLVRTGISGLDGILSSGVAKMRANPNTRSTHECEILDGRGLRVLPRQIPAPRVYPFSSYDNLISRAPVRNVERAEKKNSR